MPELEFSRMQFGLTMVTIQSLNCSLEREPIHKIQGEGCSLIRESVLEIRAHILQGACDRGSLEAAKVLVENGADVNAQSGYWGNVLLAGIYGRQTAI
ncbi:hypothetical protein C8J56DRAFT_827680, partial [Mycena floridula]